MADEIINIEELRQDSRNFNKGTEEGQALIEKSFQELGAGRSILVDKDDQIIAGNKSQKAAIKAGIMKVRVIETDGSELIAVKRTDVSLDSEKGRKLALADNATAKANLVWDEVELNAATTELGIDLEEWGVELPDMAAPPWTMPMQRRMTSAKRRIQWRPWCKAAKSGRLANIS